MTASPAPTVPLFTAEAASFGLDLAPLLQGVVVTGVEK